jgi:acetyltransferase
VRGRDPSICANGSDFSALFAFSHRIAAHKEIDINPLLASPERYVGSRRRVVLHPLSVPDAELPRPAIRPYPAQYSSQTQLHDRTPVLIRPIRPEDEPLLSRFHETLSESSVYGRYCEPLGLGARVAHERLLRVCLGDYDREIALVAEIGPKTVRGKSSVWPAFQSARR